uniref:Uncharacterized protein n=1 Tax=Ditylenchus dipsaci TaxID=166011 RepID=A0A915CYM7_9BILA
MAQKKSSEIPAKLPVGFPESPTGFPANPQWYSHYDNSAKKNQRVGIGRGVQESRCSETGLVPIVYWYFNLLCFEKRKARDRFSGNHCRKLLAGDGPKRIADVIAGNSKHSAVEKLLTVLGEAQGLAKAAFLNCAEVEQLSELTKVNEDERRFASIGVREKILKRLMEESYIRNCLFDTHDIVGE